MKLTAPSGKEAAVCAGIGAGGALLFLYVFPRGALTTMMHDVLHLPGPGAGIALIFGPFLILVALGSHRVSGANGRALIVTLTFALALALVVRLFRIPTNPKGAFGSVFFIAAVTLLGLVLEVVMALRSALSPPRRCILAGILANALLLVFYWLVIFPRTAGWVKWGDVPLLMGICLAAGVISGYLASVVSKALSRALAFMEKE